MFDVSKVSKVYSGRKGCACGCRGKYTYATAADADGRDEVSPKRVAAAVKKFVKMMQDPNTDMDCFYWDNDFVAFDMGDRDRTYTVYFRD